MEFIIYTDERADCRHCGHPVVKTDRRWVHIAPSARLVRTGLWVQPTVGSVGCHAASYDRHPGRWDDSLKKTWKAAPRR